MTIGRLSTYNLHQALLKDTTRSQGDLGELQSQISSGLKSQTFSGLGGDTEKFADLESRMSRGKTFMDTSQLLKGRLELADNVLNTVIDLATDTKNLISLRRNSVAGDSVAFQAQLEGKWQALAAQLNTTFEGRYIFSGTSTDIAPVDTTNLPALHVDGTPDAGYYNGSSDDITVRIDDNVTITYNTRADDPAFQKVMAGIAMANEYGGSAGESPEMQQAYDLIAEGVEGLIGVRAEVNANKVTVMENADRLQAQQLYWRGLKEEISNTDIISASTEVAVNQGILQAAFQTFARISSLKLSDFLR